jgi:hypothetical protein
MMYDQYQCRCAIVYDGCRLGFTKQRKRTLDVNAATAALAFPKIVFEIRITSSDFIQCLHRFGRKRGASEICVNEDSSAVDNRLQSGGAKFIERATDTIHDGFKFKERAARTNL